MTENTLYNSNKKGQFMKDKFARAILTNPANEDYLIALYNSLEPDKNIKAIGAKIITNEINNYKDAKERITDAIMEVETTKGIDLVNFEVNAFKSDKIIRKNLSYVCHMVIRMIDENTGEYYNKVVQVNINNFDRFGQGKFVYKSELFPNGEELLVIYDINVALLSKMSYDDYRKFNKLSTEYLSIIFTNNDEKIFKGNKMIMKIVKELEDMSKSLDEMLYYNPEEFLKEAALDAITDDMKKEAAQKSVTEEMKKEAARESVTDEMKKEAARESVTDEMKKEAAIEIVIEENNIAAAKELIKNGISKEIILKSIDITEKQYNDLKNEVQKETTK